MLRTARLDLVPMTRALVEAELESTTRLGEQLAARVPTGWPPGEYDRAALEFFRARFVEAGRSELEWGSFYAVARDDRTLVAAAGYHGVPDEAGSVEIGYSVVEECRKRGYATETVRALVEHALASPMVKRIVATTFESNAASVAVLHKCGFFRIGAGSEPSSVRFERAR